MRRTLLSGGGALNQQGAINQNYQDYQKATQPLASNTNYNPYDTPGFKDALSTTISDITNSTNGQFAAAGRDFSGANSQALGRGIMQGVAPTIAQQYNQNIQNQQGAAGNLYNAGNMNAGLLSGLQQQHLQNQGAGRRGCWRCERCEQRGRERNTGGGSCKARHSGSGAWLACPDRRSDCGAWRPEHG
jgi:hypothetical protein